MPPCAVCLDLLVPPLEWPDYGLQVKPDALIQTAGDGCPACTLLKDAIKLAGVDFQQVQHIDLYNLSPGSPLGMSVQLCTTPDTENTTQRSRVDLELFVTPDRLSCWSHIGVGGALPQFLSLDQSVDLARPWINDCTAQHRKCLSGPRPLPTRLIAVGNDDTEPCLFQPSTEVRDIYVPLSHCWGKERLITTTRDNLERHKICIDYADLPKTFQDAIDLLRALGIAYLWIDSLCIVQDDPEDWAREAARMSEVYTFGMFTIAADTGPDSTTGLFNADKERRSTIATLQAPSFHAGNDKVEVHMRRSGTRMINDIAHTYSQSTFDPAGIEASPLSKRAWVFQERLLSTKTLHFTRPEMAWECNTVMACECMARSEPVKSTSFKSEYIARQATEADGKITFSLYWLQIVEEFTRRSMTFTTDRLQAVSGIAKAAQETEKQRYLCGLWSGERTLLYGLLWMSGYEGLKEKAVPEDVKAHHRQPRSYAPSWSWTSVTGCVVFMEMKFERFETIKMAAELISAACSLNGPNPYGPVDDGTLVLKGTVAQVFVVQSRELAWPGSRNAVPASDGFEVVSEVSLPCSTIPQGYTHYGKSLDPIRRLASIENRPNALRDTASKADLVHLCDNVVLDVDNPVEVDFNERHYFLVIGHRRASGDELSLYDEMQRLGIDPTSMGIEPDPKAGDTAPRGLLLRKSRHRAGALERVGLVVSRLCEFGCEVWELFGKQETVTII